MARKKKNYHKHELQTKKCAIESLEFLTLYGLKQIGAEKIIQEYANDELKQITELDLVSDILSIKKLVDGIKQDLNVCTVTGKGELVCSYVCIASGINQVNDIHKLTKQENIWKELLNQKIISIYYPDKIRNEVVAWCTKNGFNVSAYLGQPIVKFNKLFLAIKRAISPSLGENI